MNLETKIVLRLVGGPADGFVLTVPTTNVPSFMGFGAPARYERDRGSGEVVVYRFQARAEH